MQAHYSTASILAYITQSDKNKSGNGAGSGLISHTQCQTNFYSWFYSLWVDTKGLLLLSCSHKIMVMIVIAIFIIIKKNTFSGHHKYYEPKGAKRNVWNNLNISDIHSFGCFSFLFFMYSIYLYLYRSSASFLEITNEKTQKGCILWMLCK